jgi:peptide/nickel transport system permease protein
VRSEVLPRLARSVTIAVAAMLVAVPLALLLGTWLGRRSGTKTDVGSSFVLLLLNSLPEFVIGLLALTLLGVLLGVLPEESSGALFGSGWTAVKAYILPVLTLVAVVTPYMARMARVQVRETLGQPYVRTAVLRGVGPRRLTWRHIVPNASIPVVNVVALNMAELLGGLVVVEVVFAFPGLGQLLVDSVQGKDIPVVQAVALLAALGFVVINALADAVVLALNPRLRTAA